MVIKTALIADDKEWIVVSFGLGWEGAGITHAYMNSVLRPAYKLIRVRPYSLIRDPALDVGISIFSG